MFAWVLEDCEEVVRITDLIELTKKSYDLLTQPKSDIDGI